jgi:hypothetical protein
VKAVHLIDWAASRSAVGAGVHLLRMMTGLADVLLTIGGSQDTRNVLPKLGYKRRGELRRYARVSRPWLQLRTTTAKNWKTPLKFLRNSARVIGGVPRVPDGWQAAKVTSFTGAINGGAVGQTTSSTSPRRTAAELDYLLSCPAARFSGFTVRQADQLRGYFVLAQVGGQARIVDVRSDRDDSQSWQAICALAARTAGQDPATCEIVVASSIDATENAWLQAGFIHRETEPILCYDPRSRLRPESPLNLNLADGDSCFLSDPLSPYLS